MGSIEYFEVVTMNCQAIAINRAISQILVLFYNQLITIIVWYHWKLGSISICCEKGGIIGGDNEEGGWWFWNGGDFRSYVPFEIKGI